MTKLDRLFKTRDITSLIKVCIVKAIVFPVVMYGCENWTIKKTGLQRIDTLELWCWWRLLRVPWTARRSNQSILKEISPEQSLEGLMLKLKLRYLGQLIRRTDSLEQTLILGKTQGRRRKGMTVNEMVGWHHRFNGHKFEPTPGDSERQGSLVCYSLWGHKESDTTERLKNNSITLNLLYLHWRAFLFSRVPFSNFSS